MCVIIDTNAFHAVFNRNSERFPDYEPVLKFLTSGRGYLIYGGKKYRQELRKSLCYVPFFEQLNKARRLLEADYKMVQAEERSLKRRINDPRCNDAHLIAILKVSGCELICTEDRQADKFIQRKDLYNPPQRRPSIYRSLSHKKLLLQKAKVRLRNCAHPYSVKLI